MTSEDRSIILVMRRMAHDLRSPMASIVGNVRFALSPTGVAADVKEALEDALEAAAQMDLQLTDTLDICRWVDGTLEARPVALAIGDVVAGVADDLQPRMSRRKQRIEATGALSVRARADPELLRRALGNVLGLALARSVPGTAVRLDATVEAGLCLMRVSDGGRAMDAVERDSLLTPPGAAALATLLAHRHRGLVMARAALEAMGGTFGVEAAGGGSEIVLGIPAP